MTEAKQIKWNQVVILISLSGKKMNDLINLMIEVKKFNYFIQADLEGIAEEHLMEILLDFHYTPMRLKDLPSSLEDIEYFKQASIYLFEEYPETWDDADHTFDSYLVNQTDSTIRAMNGYAYIYTPYDSIVEILKKNYTIEEIKTDYLENLDYPY